MFLQKKKADYFIIGLGNKGKDYSHTKHNAGFDIVDILSKKYGGKFALSGKIMLCANVKISGKNVMLIKPQTFMNSSGEAVCLLFKKYGARIDNIIIIYDDVDLDLGKIRIKKRGGAGTHNGMKSVINSIKSEEFLRLRVGIGKPDGDIIKYVLSTYSKGDAEIALSSYSEAAEAAEAVINEGAEIAQQKYN